VSRRPDLFIIGAPKCGTTSLYEYLKGHPEIYMSVAKEPRYFQPDFTGPGSAHDLHYGDDADRYLKLFEGAGDEKRLGEASAGYIYSEAAPRLIRDFQPDAHIIVMLRNPVEMIYSLHNQRVASGREDIADFAAAVAPEPAGRRSLYLDRGRFGSHLPRWLDTFGRERVHVIIFEDMVRQPEATFRRVLEFLGVDPDYQPPSFAAHNTSHRPLSRRFRSILHARFPQWLIWRAVPGIIGDSRARALVRRFRHSRFGRKAAPRAPLPASLRAELENEFAPDVAYVSQLLARDLEGLWWRREVVPTPVGATA